MYSARSAKKDLNQPAIEKALTKAGAVVLSIHQVKNAFDMVVAFRGQVYLMEVKNPSTTSKKKRLQPELSLTDGEAGCHADFARVGVKIHIVFSVDEALQVIKAW